LSSLGISALPLDKLASAYCYAVNFFKLTKLEMKEIWEAVLPVAVKHHNLVDVDSRKRSIRDAGTLRAFVKNRLCRRRTDICKQTEIGAATFPRSRRVHGLQVSPHWHHTLSTSEHIEEDEMPKMMVWAGGPS
jgi:hypothetical protein